MVEATKAMYTNYANFNGRTSRRDYWMGILGYFLLCLAVSFVAGIINGVTKSSIGSTLLSLFSLASIIPALAMEVRRLHDVNKSGWYICIAFIPIVGSILLLIQLCTPSVNENNNY